MMKSLRVGAVSYLNAKPLYYRLEEFAPGVEEDGEVHLLRENFRSFRKRL